MQWFRCLLSWRYNQHFIGSLVKFNLIGMVKTERDAAVEPISNGNNVNDMVRSNTMSANANNCPRHFQGHERFY